MKNNESALPIPNPKTQLNVIKRYLHIIALLQNDNDPQGWNAGIIADYLSFDENENEIISDKVVRDYIYKKLEKELDIEIDHTQGGRKLSIAEDIDEETLFKLLNAYSSFVVHDLQKEQLLRVLMVKKPKETLWILARIYFAIKMKKCIKIDYTNAENKDNSFELNPYFMTIRDNGLYLVGKRIKYDVTRSFVINRISKIEILDTVFEENIPEPSEVYRNSYGASFNSESVVNLTIRYKQNVRNRIEDSIMWLEPKIEEYNEWIQAAFDVSDIKTICKQLFVLGADAEIVAPIEVRLLMEKMLKESLKLYTEK